MPLSTCFIGAGASVPFGIPTMARMVVEFEENLKASYSPLVEFFNNIKFRLQAYDLFDIEALITVLQDIINADPVRVINHPSIHYFSSWYDGFERMVSFQKKQAITNLNDAQELLKQLKGFIANSCSIKERRFEIYEEFFQRILSQQGYDLRVAVAQPTPTATGYKIFTTNYDPVIEAFFDSKGLQHECGQTRQQLLDISLGNPNLYHQGSALFQIYKLHGSTNWYRDQSGRLRWLTEAAQAGRTTIYGDEVIQELLIYPVREKYTFREPFYTMFHHLKECLLRSEVCYIIGYSFRDEDVLGIFHDAMELNPRLRLSLIDPEATTIVSDKFENYTSRVQQTSQRFSVAACKYL